MRCFCCSNHSIMLTICISAGRMSSDYSLSIHMINVIVSIECKHKSVCKSKYVSLSRFFKVGLTWIMNWIFLSLPHMLTFQQKNLFPIRPCANAAIVWKWRLYKDKAFKASDTIPKCDYFYLILYDVFAIPLKSNELCKCKFSAESSIRPWLISHSYSELII